MSIYRESNDYVKHFPTGTPVKVVVEIMGEEVFHGKGEVRSSETGRLKIDLFKEELPEDLVGEEFLLYISNIAGDLHFKGCLRSEPKTKSRLIVAMPYAPVVIRQRRAIPFRYNAFIPFSCLLATSSNIEEVTTQWFSNAAKSSTAPHLAAHFDQFLQRKAAKLLTGDSKTPEILPMFINLSPDGFRIITPAAIEAGRLLKFELHLPLNMPKTIPAVGYILRSEPVEDDDVDAEMISHAKRLFGATAPLHQTAGSFVAITKDGQDLIHTYLTLEKRHMDGSHKGGAHGNS